MCVYGSWLEAFLAGVSRRRPARNSPLYILHRQREGERWTSLALALYTSSAGIKRLFVLI